MAGLWRPWARAAEAAYFCVFAFSLAVPTPRDSISFWPAYQQRWAALLCDQTEGLQGWIEQTVRSLARGEMDVPDIAAARSALDDLSARFKRVESLRPAAPAVSSAFDLPGDSEATSAENSEQATDPALPADSAHADSAHADSSDVAALDAELGLHFLRYGAAILSAPAPPKNGENALRYGEVRGILEQLKSWLGALEIAPQVVLGLADRDSQIIGRALALRLKMRFDDATADSFGQSEALIVAADSRSIRSFALTTIFPDQVLFAFNLHREGGTLAPDVAGLARPGLVLPWHLETPEEGDDDETPIREASSIAAQIAATRAITDASWPARLEFYRARGSLLAAGNPRLSRLPMLPESA